VNQTARSRLSIGIPVVVLCALSLAGYKAYTTLYDQILERSGTWHLKVEEINGTSPLQLRVTTDTMGSAPVIRKVTTRRHNGEITILYHLALAGLAKPALYWGKAYTLTVPDSVNEVRFGRQEIVIWRRSGSTE
jgi:hypothetical protein